MLLLSVVASHASAEVPANATTHLNAAYSALDGLIRRARPNGTLPRWSEPESAKVLEQLWDAAAILGRPPYASKDTPLLLGILQKQVQVLKTYTLFPPGPGMAPDTVRNSAVFQDEIARAQVFVIKTIAAALPAMNDSVGQLGPLGMTDMRRQGLRRTRQGLQELITGAVLSLRNPALRPANQGLLAESLRDNAAVLASATPRSDRAALVASIQLALPTLAPAARAPMQSVASTLSSAPCDRLCALE
ncbi:MAG: hypothetical protein ACRCVA_14090 [Phreatobacter sp.]